MNSNPKESQNQYDGYDQISYIRLLGKPSKKIMKALSGIVVYVAAFSILSIISVLAFKYIVDMRNVLLDLKRMETIVEILEKFYFRGLDDWFLFLLAPAAIFTYRIVYGNPPGVLISVKGRFRWEWMKKSLFLLLPLLSGVTVGQILIDEIPVFIFSFETLEAVLLSVLLTPLQSAGEEYLFRGFILQVFATFIKSEKWAWIISSTISSIIFSMLHFPENIYTGIDFFVFGILMCGLVYFTKGLEASVLFHTLNNLFLNILLGITDGNSVFVENKIMEEPFIEGIIVSIITDILICGTVVWIWKKYENKKVEIS